MNHDPLNRYLEQYNVYPTSKAEIVAAYQEKYPGLGRNGWKQHLVHDLLPFTKQTGKNPAKNLEKRFDTGPKGRLNNPEPRNKGQYEALGKTLAPLGKKVPADGITLKIDFKETDGKRRQPTRTTPDLHLDHSLAVEWIMQEQPDYSTLFDQWPGDRDDMGSSLFGEDGAYPADILDVY